MRPLKDAFFRPCQQYHSMDKYYLSISWCILLSYALALTQAAQEAALITHLPGFNGTFLSKHYSGYVNVEEKNLFYYFVVSERNPLKDAVVLWLNGGPGCSSFDGFVYEHGPFNFQGHSKGSLPTLHSNPYSWSKVSNIIYLDSPVGVGLSYSQNTSVNASLGDLTTAADTHSFLLKWFKLYPEFINNPFYIAGESYAGIYVPTLASQVVKGIKAGVKPVINFKGYMVGNGVTDTKFDGNALVPFAHGMGLISEDIYQEAQSACKGNYYEPNEECFMTLRKVDEAISGLNMYDILEQCYHDASSKQGKQRLPESFQELGKGSNKIGVRNRMFGRAWPLWAPVKDGIVPLWPQLAEQGSVRCVDDEVATAWLNDASVRTAIHAAAEEKTGPWELCTHKISYRHDAGSMISYHKTLTSLGYPALIYSGDHDMCVPFTGSYAWTRSLGYKITDEWRSWFSNNQVAGYLQEYEKNLTFLTIKGAGHTVPEYKPQEALDFYTRWLDGLPI